MQFVGTIHAAQQHATRTQQRPLVDFKIQGHSENCSDVIDRREHLLVGISPFNSRFCPHYVESLLAWGFREFDHVDILLPDEASAAILLIASGDSDSKAARKTRKELNRHRRSLQVILSGMGNLRPGSRIIEFSEYFDNPNYAHARDAVQRAFDSCGKFRSACVEMSLHAIRSRTRITQSECSDQHACEVAARYVLNELPFYLCTADLIGSSTSVLAYHRKWPIGDALLAGEFPLAVDARQGHGIVSMVSDGDAKPRFI